jgi:hypothetical protein
MRCLVILKVLGLMIIKISRCLKKKACENLVGRAGLPKLGRFGSFWVVLGRFGSFWGGQVFFDANLGFDNRLHYAFLWWPFPRGRSR